LWIAAFLGGLCSLLSGESPLLELLALGELERGSSKVTNRIGGRTPDFFFTEDFAPFFVGEGDVLFIFGDFFSGVKEVLLDLFKV